MDPEPKAALAVDALPEFLTVLELAELLRQHPETVRRLLRDGRLRSVRINPAGSGRRLVSRAALVAFLEARTVGEVLA